MSARAYHGAALAAYIALIVLTLAWEGWLAPAAQFPPGFWLTLKSLPLLLPLFGLLAGRPRAFAWAVLLILVFMIEALVLVVARRQLGLDWRSPLPYAWLELVLTIVFFAAAIGFLRTHRTRAPDSA